MQVNPEAFGSSAVTNCHLRARPYNLHMAARAMTGNQAIVLLSGGMDSCVCAATARERHGAGNVALLHASYGQRTESREARAFAAIADFYGIKQRLMVRLDCFRAIGGSALTDPNIAVPQN